MDQEERRGSNENTHERSAVQGAQLLGSRHRQGGFRASNVNFDGSEYADKPAGSGEEQHAKSPYLAMPVSGAPLNFTQDRCSTSEMLFSPSFRGQQPESRCCEWTHLRSGTSSSYHPPLLSQQEVHPWHHQPPHRNLHESYLHNNLAMREVASRRTDLAAAPAPGEANGRSATSSSYYRPRLPQQEVHPWHHRPPHHRTSHESFRNTLAAANPCIHSSGRAFGSSPPPTVDIRCQMELKQQKAPKTHSMKCSSLPAYEAAQACPDLSATRKGKEQHVFASALHPPLPHPCSRPLQHRPPERGSFTPPHPFQKQQHLPYNMNAPSSMQVGDRPSAVMTRPIPGLHPPFPQMKPRPGQRWENQPSRLWCPDAASAPLPTQAAAAPRFSGPRHSSKQPLSSEKGAVVSLQCSTSSSALTRQDARLKRATNNGKEEPQKKGGRSDKQSKARSLPLGMTAAGKKRKTLSNPSLTNNADSLGIDTTAKTKRKSGKKGQKKEEGMPRRALSAYNIFFSEERERILAELPEPTVGTESKGEKEHAHDVDGDGKESALAKDEGMSMHESIPLKKRKLRAAPGISTSGCIPRNSTRMELHHHPPSSSQDGSVALPFQGFYSSAAHRVLIERRSSAAEPLGQKTKKRRHRKTHGKIGFRDLAQLIGQRWKNLPDHDKEQYRKLAGLDMVRYKEDKEKFEKRKKQSDLHYA